MRAIATLALAISLTIPAYGEEVPPKPAGDGLTREMFTEQKPVPPAPASTRATSHAQARRTRHNPKHFRSVHHGRRHRRVVRKHSPVAAVAVASAPRHRNPVVGFVYWWNGWVMRTFHTKVGTVMLGTVGAKT